MDYLIGWFLVCGPIEFPDRFIDHPGVHECIVAYCVSNDCMIEKERWYTISLCRSAVELCRDCPHSSLAIPFKIFDKTIVMNRLQFSLAYQDYCKEQKFLFPQFDNEWDNCLEEAKYLHRVWDLVDDLHNEYLPHFTKRIKLGELKRLLGDEAFYSASLPPFVPLWRFSQF